MTAPLTAPPTEQSANDGLETALTAVRERLRHWQDKRDPKGFAPGIVEDELRVIEKMLHARRRG